MKYKDVKIIGLGSSLGSIKVSNQELATRLSYSPDEIEQKTGIKNRWQINPFKENIYVLMAEAVEQAVNSAGVLLDKIKGIFVATDPICPYQFPNPSTILAYLLAIDNSYSWIGGSGCCGGLQALESASNKLMCGEDDPEAIYAVIGADHISAMVERGTIDEMIFSDSAACLLLTKSKKFKAYYSLEFVNGITTYQGAKALTLRRDDPILKHDGRAIFKFAIQCQDKILSLMQVDKFPQDAYLILHQANLRIVDILAGKLNCQSFYRDGIINIGNTSSSSVFIGLEEVTRRQLHSDCHNIVLASFGEGLSVFVCRLTINASGEQLCLPGQLNSATVRQNYWQRYHAEY